ncbi:MAG: hypothetical protein ABR975_15570 [Vulcanimicrobiaceae bacterium]
MFLVMALVGAPLHFEPAIRAGQTLSVHDISGAVRVRVGARLAIDARRTANRSDPNAVVVHVETRSDGVAVCVRYPPDAARGCNEHTHGANDNDTQVDFDITVPAGVAVNAADVNGSVDVVAAGSTRGTSVDGDVRIDAPEITEATTVNGAVRVYVRARGTAPLRASSVNGRIVVSLPPGGGATVDAKTLNGEINGAGLSVQHGMFGVGTTATGTIGNGERHLDLSSVNGSIEVERG